MRLKRGEVACPPASVEARSGGWVQVKPTAWVLGDALPALFLHPTAALHPTPLLALRLTL